MNINVLIPHAGPRKTADPVINEICVNWTVRYKLSFQQGKLGNWVKPADNNHQSIWGWMSGLYAGEHV